MQLFFLYEVVILLPLSHQRELKWLPKIGIKSYDKYDLRKTEGSHFLMRIANKEKLEMCKEHVLNRKSLSHIRESFNFFNSKQKDNKIFETRLSKGKIKCKKDFEK